MGRPAMVPDEAIKLDLPREARGLPSPLGLQAQIRLSRISHFIASNVYDVSKHTAEPASMTTCIYRSLDQLESWKLSLPPCLQYVEGSISQDRAVYELQMASNHLFVLSTRSWLFDAVKIVTASVCLKTTSYSDYPHKVEIERATAASRQTISLAKQLGQTREQSTLSHTTIHHVFNAALVLELRQIMSSTELTDDRDQISYITSLLDIQDGSNKPFAKDCSGVLADLACIMRKLRKTGFNFERDRDNAGFGQADAGSMVSHSTWDRDPTAHLPSRLLQGQPEVLQQVEPNERALAFNELASWLPPNTSHRPFLSGSGRSE